MVRLLNKRMSRRRFLAATGAGAALAGYALQHPPALWSAPSGAVRPLIYEVSQDPTELRSGDGTNVAGAPSDARWLESSPVASPAPFTHVAVHYKIDGVDAAGVAIALRTSADGRRWSDWHALETEARPDENPRRQTFSTLVRASKHRYAQYRVSIPEGTFLRSVAVTFLNTVDGPVIEQPRDTSSAAGASDASTFSREAWGADEGLRFSNGWEIWPQRYVPTKKLVVHHTVTGNDYANIAQAKADVRAIYAYHASTLGWGDIGYNALIDKFGNIYEGRRGRNRPDGRELFSEDLVAGHASAHNYGSAGIALLGTFCSSTECAGGARPTRAMRDRLRDLLVWKCARHRIDPMGRSDYLLSTDAWNRGLPNISGHRDCGSTLCPGGQAYDLLPALREEVAERLADSAAPIAALTAAPPQRTATSGNAAYEWSASGGAGEYEYSYCLEGWTFLSTRPYFSYLRGFTSDRRPRWSEWTPDTSVSFSDLPDGHYTFHVRVRDRDGKVSTFRADLTLLMVNQTPDAGDANCDGEVDAIDSLAIMQAEGGLTDEVPCSQQGDVNQDGHTNTVDASLILQYSAGLLPTLPPP